MVAYSFQARFADMVADGRKLQTIRTLGKKRHARSGERVQLYTGMRTKACRKLVTPDPVCVESQLISLIRGWPRPCGTFDIETPGGPALLMMAVDVPGFHEVRENESHADGFKSVEAMRDWFDKTHGFPFYGVLIRWEPAP